MQSNSRKNDSTHAQLGLLILIQTFFCIVILSNRVSEFIKMCNLKFDKGNIMPCNVRADMNTCENERIYKVK